MAVCEGGRALDWLIQSAHSLTLFRDTDMTIDCGFSAMIEYQIVGILYSRGVDH